MAYRADFHNKTLNDYRAVFYSTRLIRALLEGRPSSIESVERGEEFEILLSE